MDVRQQALATIEEKMEKARKLVAECEVLALQHELTFSLDMGGTDQWFETEDPNKGDEGEDWYSSFEAGWKNSSSYC